MQYVEAAKEYAGVMRCAVPGGWLVAVKGDRAAITFYPDANHEWAKTHKALWSREGLWFFNGKRT